MTYVPPQSRRVTLSYFYRFGQTEAITAGISHWFRLNSVYDVDTAVGSTTIPGFSEWAALFGNYRVWKAKVKVDTFYLPASNNSVGQVVLVPSAYNTVLPASPEAWPSQYQAVSKPIVPLVNGGNAAVVTLIKQYDLPSIARLTPSQYANDMDFSALCSANPARQIYLAVCGFSWNAASNNIFEHMIHVAFEVEFFNPVPLST